MMDSKAVAAIKQTSPGVWTLYIRVNYIESLGIWSFAKHLRDFNTGLEASLFFVKTYPQGRLIDFDDLTTGE